MRLAQEVILLLSHVLYISERLVKKKIKVTRGGLSFYQIFYVKSDSISSEISGIIGTDKELRKEAGDRGFKVPPAWKDIWINKNSKDAIQVIGEDLKGRRVAIYSVEHSKKSAAEKFSRLKAFTKVKSVLTDKINKDFYKKEEAQILYLIDKTGFRIGSDQDTKAKVHAFGASTLTSDHVTVNNDDIIFKFVGKKGVLIRQKYKDKKLASLFKNKKGNLFKTSGDKVRKYLKSIDKRFKVKDFRTYKGTSEALKKISEIKKPEDAKTFKKAVALVSKHVASVLGNTPSVAKEAYITPEVWDLWKIQELKI